MTISNITVLGDGAMATVCATLLAGQGYRVTLWSAFPEHIEQMAATGRNDEYLPEAMLPTELRLTADVEHAMAEAHLVVSAIPTQYIRPVWQQFADHTDSLRGIVSVAKGIETDTLLRPTQVIADVLGVRNVTLGAMSGPSIASELSRCLPATIAVASNDHEFVMQLQRMFTTQWLRVYTNTDLLGVELAGATKNVIALAAGILDGLQAGYNAKSALLARGLAEITRLGVAMGARSETFFGIAGIGDLATTCFCPTGRNRSAGEWLGKGRKLDDVLSRIKGIVEGIPTTRAVMQLAEHHDVDMPITAAVNDVLFCQLDPIEAIARLMQRQLKEERVG